MPKGSIHKSKVDLQKGNLKTFKEKRLVFENVNNTYAWRYFNARPDQ